MSDYFTDEELLAAVDKWHSAPTYVLANMVRSDTPRVLRRMKKLEREGKVKRVKTSYLVMIAWAKVKT